MQSIYEKLYLEITKKLMHEKDKELLKEFIETLKNSGKDALREKIKKMVDELYSRGSEL